MDDYLFKVDISDRVTAYVYSIYEEPIDEAVGIFEYHSEVDGVELKKNGEWVDTVEHENLLRIHKEDLAEALVEYGKEQAEKSTLFFEP